MLIVSRTSQKNTIMKAIMEGANPKAGTIVFSLPVTDTAGLRLMEEDEAQPEAACDPLKIDPDIRLSPKA